jgi:hypothetical protein
MRMHFQIEIGMRAELTNRLEHAERLHGCPRYRHNECARPRRAERLRPRGRGNRERPARHPPCPRKPPVPRPRRNGHSGPGSPIPSPSLWRSLCRICWDDTGVDRSVMATPSRSEPAISSSRIRIPDQQPACKPSPASARISSRSRTPMAGIPTSISGTPRASRRRAMSIFSSSEKVTPPIARRRAT